MATFSHGCYFAFFDPPPLCQNSNPWAHFAAAVMLRMSAVAIKKSHWRYFWWFLFWYFFGNYYHFHILVSIFVFISGDALCIFLYQSQCNERYSEPLMQWLILPLPRIKYNKISWTKNTSAFPTSLLPSDSWHSPTLKFKLYQELFVILARLWNGACWQYNVSCSVNGFCMQGSTMSS